MLRCLCSPDGSIFPELEGGVRVMGRRRRSKKELGGVRRSKEG